MNIPEIDLPVYNVMARKEKVFWTIMKSREYNCEYIFIEEIKYQDWVINITNNRTEVFDLWELEVVRREIVMSDVLLFLSGIENFHCDWCQKEKDFKAKKVIEVWDLFNPYYSQQSKECKAFIRSLI